MENKVFETVFGNIMRDQFAYCESAVPWQLGFQDPATPIMEGIVTLHHEVMAIIVFIGVFVAYLMVRCVQLFKKDVPSVVDNPWSYVVKNLLNKFHLLLLIFL